MNSWYVRKQYVPVTFAFSLLILRNGNCGVSTIKQPDAITINV